jgi:hypothetical protein
VRAELDVRPKDDEALGNALLVRAAEVRRFKVPADGRVVAKVLLLLSERLANAAQKVRVLHVRKQSVFIEEDVLAVDEPLRS